MGAKRHPWMVLRGAEDLWTLDTCKGPFENDFEEKIDFRQDENHGTDFQSYSHQHCMIQILEEREL